MRNQKIHSSVVYQIQSQVRQYPAAEWDELMNEISPSWPYFRALTNTFQRTRLNARQSQSIQDYQRLNHELLELHSPG